MGDFTINYDPFPGTCACGEDIDSVHVVVDGQPSCKACAARVCDYTIVSVAEGLWWFDGALCDAEAAGPDGDSVGLARRVLDIAYAVASHRIQAPTHAYLSDRAFAMEVFHRATRASNQKLALDIVNEFTDLSQDEQTELLGELRGQAADRQADNESNIHIHAVAGLVFERAGITSGPVTLNEAAERLGVDLDRLYDVVTVKCAEHGKPVDGLAEAVIDECFDAAKVNGGDGRG